MEIQELKSKAYDLLASIEWSQNQLRLINQKIAELSKAAEAPVEAPKLEAVK